MIFHQERSIPFDRSSSEVELAMASRLASDPSEVCSIGRSLGFAGCVGILPAKNSSVCRYAVKWVHKKFPIGSTLHIDSLVVSALSAPDWEIYKSDVSAGD
jgi:hypothetical protein